MIMAQIKKLDLASTSGASLNLEALYQICPQCFTEVKDEKTGQIERKINFTTLRELLGDNAYEGADEEYGFSWVGKRAAQKEAGRPINKTLRPCPEESVDWEHTQNLYIEGDNLDVLKLLQKSYLGAIKMIYIDPPYNTGNDFVYRDDFAMSKDDYDLEAGNTDELGNRFRRNTDSNLRFHSDWCSMMLERLTIARNLLTNDGIIFISIGDEEIDNLRKVCDEVFGADNFRNQIAIRRGAKSVQAQFDTWDKLGRDFEYILFYTKNPTYRFPQQVRTLEETKPGSWNNHWRGTDRPTMRYPLLGITPSTGQWRWSKERSDIAVENYKRLIAEIPNPTDSQIDSWLIKQGKELDLLRLSSNGKPEHYIPSNNTTLLNSSWMDLLVGSSSEINKLFDSKVFDTAKLTQVIIRMLGFVADDSIVLDFFSGSATTAHAVMLQNAKDGGSRKFIMVQIPEETPADSEARLAGYGNICEIGKERIRRAGKKIKAENSKAKDLDTGFRVFKLDDSNMQDVYFAPKELQQQDLFALVNNVKENRTDLDLLFGCMLDWGVQLSLPLTKQEVDSKTIHIVNDGDLVACFDDGINEEVINAIAALDPLRVVFRDSGFESAPLKINLFEMFKQKCGWSEENVTDRVRII